MAAYREYKSVRQKEKKEQAPSYYYTINDLEAEMEELVAMVLDEVTIPNTRADRNEGRPFSDILYNLRGWYTQERNYAPGDDGNVPKYLKKYHEFFNEDHFKDIIQHAREKKGLLVEANFFLALVIIGKEVTGRENWLGSNAPLRKILETIKSKARTRQDQVSDLAAFFTIVNDIIQEQLPEHLFPNIIKGGEGRHRQWRGYQIRVPSVSIGY